MNEIEEGIEDCLDEINRLRERVAELEAALHKVAEKSKHAFIMSYEADYYRIATMALKGEKDENDNH